MVPACCPFPRPPLSSCCLLLPQVAIAAPPPSWALLCLPQACPSLPEPLVSPYAPHSSSQTGLQGFFCFLVPAPLSARGLRTGSLAPAARVPERLVTLLFHLFSNLLWAALEGSWLGKPFRSVGQPTACPGPGLLVILSGSGLLAHGIATLSFLLSKQAAFWEGGMSWMPYPELPSTSFWP